MTDVRLKIRTDESGAKTLFWEPGGGAKAELLGFVGEGRFRSADDRLGDLDRIRWSENVRDTITKRLGGGA